MSKSSSNINITKTKVTQEIELLSLKISSFFFKEGELFQKIDHVPNEKHCRVVNTMTGEVSLVLKHRKVEVVDVEIKVLCNN